MADYTKTYTIDFTQLGDTVYEGVDKLEDNIDSIVTWASDLKDNYSAASAPTSPSASEGQLWWDSTNDIFSVYNGSAWVALIGCVSVYLHDTNSSNTMTVVWNEDDTSDRTLNLLVAGGDRSLTFNENFTIGDGNAGTLTYSAASKTLTVNETLTLDGASGKTLTLEESLTVGDGNDGTITFSAASKTLTVADSLTVSGATVNSVASDSGTATPSSNAFTIAGGEGIDTSGAGATVTIAGEDATDSNKGIASFNAQNFTVSSGAVSLNIDDTPVDGETDEPITSNWAYDHVAAADPHTGYMLESLLDAKGDIFVASADNTPARLAVGSNDQVLMADSAQATGVKWATGTGGWSTDYRPVLPILYDSVGQGTWAWAPNEDDIFGGWVLNSTHADGDNISWSTVYLEAGTYTLRVVYSKSSNSGICDFYIDAAEVASVDMYAASATYNQKDDTTGITIASSGNKTIKMEVDGKNGSSSDHYTRLLYLIFIRTA